MYCGKCGAMLFDNSKFCEQCGNLIEAETKPLSMYASIVDNNQSHSNQTTCNTSSTNFNNLNTNITTSKQEAKNYPAMRNCGAAIRMKLWGWIITPIAAFLSFIALILCFADIDYLLFFIISLIFLSIGIFLFIDSHLIKNGTLKISDDVVSYIGRAGNVNIKTRDITAVQLSGSRVKIVYGGGYLTIDSFYSGKISTDISKRTNIHGSVSNLMQKNVSNADEIRKYKELLDIGAINQEQYDNVLKKLL